jgi:hypothetical protein
MNKFRALLITLLGIFFLAGISLIIFNFFVPKTGGLLIETSPASTVYINGEDVGRTPYTSLRKPGEVTLRLVPDTFGTPLPPFEGRINLVSGVETVVRRFFGSSDIYTEGEILTFEKLPSSKSTGISIMSDPENVQVEIDSVSKGTTPINSSSIDRGTHRIKFSAVGYKDRIIDVNLEDGYKLVALLKLSKSEQAIPSVTQDQNKKTYERMVKVLDTPTGFLRVRDEASTSAKEIGQVRPGEEYVYVDKDPSGNWFKVDLKKGVVGWITSQYSELFEREIVATDSGKPV